MDSFRTLLATPERIDPTLLTNRTFLQYYDCIRHSPDLTADKLAVSLNIPSNRLRKTASKLKEQKKKLRGSARMDFLDQSLVLPVETVCATTRPCESEMLADITESIASQSLAHRNEELHASVQALTVKANTYKRDRTYFQRKIKQLQVSRDSKVRKYKESLNTISKQQQQFRQQQKKASMVNVTHTKEIVRLKMKISQQSADIIVLQKRLCTPSVSGTFIAEPCPLQHIQNSGLHQHVTYLESLLQDDSEVKIYNVIKRCYTPEFQLCSESSAMRMASSGL
jgi:hypothetical protein